MPRFNLLKPIKSIRNTITPYTIAPGRRSSKFPKVMLGLALIVVGASAALVALGIVKVSYSPDRIPPVIIDFTGGENRTDVAINKSQHDTDNEKEPAAIVADSGEPAPDETEKYHSVTVADSGKPAPDEIESVEQLKGAIGKKGSSEDVAALVLRPIAQKATIAIKKPESGRRWYIRFALCVIESSCQRIVTRLNKQGVNAYIVKGVANITTHRAIVGPWSTNAQAKQGKSRLKQDGHQGSIFTSGGSFFLSTEPLASKEVAERECRKIKMSWSGCRLLSKKEARRVYKIYEGAYKSKRSAVDKRMAYSRRGIDSIVESY
jgi:cell division septation protein DedD